MYKQEQIDYVNSINEKDLRNNLLHQIRLRDLIEEDRNEFEKLYNELLLKYRRMKGNGLQLDDYDKLKKNQTLILNHNNGSEKEGSEFLFQWCDGASFVVRKDEQDIYLNRASILFFHTKEQWG